MTLVGYVESLWRYPVKSMRGEQLPEAFLGIPGVYGDRRYAFHSSKARASFPYFTAREQTAMLRYRAAYRYHGPPSNDLSLDVETPCGKKLAIDDPQLLTLLAEGANGEPTLRLLRSESAIADCQPISIFSLQTARQLSQELKTDVDKRRFRANIYIDLQSNSGFGEDGFVGHRLQIGDTAVVTVIERDPRCKMITLDPDTSAPNPGVMRQVAGVHGGTAGVYGAVLVEGNVRQGDAVLLLN